MNRPDKSDIEAHGEWLDGVADRLYAARTRHPYLVLRAARWFVQSQHSKAVVLEHGEDYFVTYSPMEPFKPVLAFVHRVMHEAYGCTCGVNCDCGRTPKITRDNHQKVFWQMARWVRTATSKGWATI